MAEVFPVSEGQHSIVGPSAAERWLNCSGSVLLTKDVPDTPSRYAIEGTAAHTLSEWVRREGKKARDFEGRVIRVSRGDLHSDVKVDEEMIDAVQEFVDRVNEQPGDELIEIRVDYTPYVKGGFGTLDSAKLNDGTCYITDFKYGQGVKKEASNNPQLLLYALGVYLEYGSMYDIKEFVLCISQPRLDHWDEWPIGIEALLHWAEHTAKPAGIKTQTPGAPTQAGEWCQFCRIKATCKTRMESVFAAVTGDFHDLDSAVSNTEALASTVPLMTNEEVGKALAAWPWIEKWGAALKSYAMQQIREGHAVGDFKIVAGRSARAWAVEEKEVVAALVAAGADKKKLYTKPELISPAQAEKILGKPAFAPASDRTIAGPLAGLVSKGKGKPTLAPGSDPRAPLTSDATEDFEELED